MMHVVLSSFVKCLEPQHFLLSPCLPIVPASPALSKTICAGIATRKLPIEFGRFDLYQNWWNFFSGFSPFLIEFVPFVVFVNEATLIGTMRLCIWLHFSIFFIFVCVTKAHPVNTLLLFKLPVGVDRHYAEHRYVVSIGAWN